MCSECKRQCELDSAGGLDLYIFVSSLEILNILFFWAYFKPFVYYLKETILPHMWTISSFPELAGNLLHSKFYKHRMLKEAYKIFNIPLI